MKPFSASSDVDSVGERGGVRVYVNECCYTAYGLTKEFMLKHKLKVPLSRTVIVRRVSGLNDDINEAKLMEVFSLAGEVKKIERAKNYAKIEYDHPLEAVQAISMLDGQKLFNQNLLVEMDVLARSKRLPLGLADIGPGLGRNGEALRGVRIEAELRRVYELFADLGKMEILNAEDNSPFKFIYKHPKRKFNKEFLARKSVPSNYGSSRDQTSTNNAASKSSKSPRSFNRSKTADYSIGSEDSTVPEVILPAIQALGTALVAHGLIPPQTNCKSLQSILTALQKKTLPKQNLSISLPDQSNSNSNIDITASNEPNRTPTPSVAVPNPGLLNLIPNRTEALDKAINNVMQFMPPNPVNPFPVLRNPAQNVRNVAPNTSNLTASNFNQTLPIPAKSGPVGGNPALKVNPPFLRYPSQPLKKQGKKKEKYLVPRITRNVPLRPFCNPPTPQLFNQNRPMYDQYDVNRTLREVPTQPILPQQIQPEQISPQQIPPKQIPTTQIQPKQIPPQQIPPQQIPPQQNPPKQIPTTQIPPKEVQPQSQNKKERKSGMLMFKNLPPCVTTATLDSKMREVGEVKFCEITGGGRGFVRFKHTHDANRCIRLFHRSKVDGQVIDVGFL